MLRFYAVLLSALLFGSTVFAQDFRISGGIAGNAAMNDMVITSATTNGSSYYYMAGVNAFFDFKYASASFGYIAEVGNIFGTGNVPAPAMNLHYGFISVSIVGKLPIQVVEGFQLFPYLGLGYDRMVTNDYISSAASKDIDAASDLFLLVGLGTDIDLSPDLYLRIQADFDFNLTPGAASIPPGINYFGFKVNLGAGLGIRF